MNFIILNWARLDFSSRRTICDKIYCQVQILIRKMITLKPDIMGRKEFDGAIAMCKKYYFNKSGANTKARVYKLIADSYLQKRDTATAKQYVDQYFAKAKPEEVTADAIKNES